MVLQNIIEPYEVEIELKDLNTGESKRDKFPAESLVGARHVGILALTQLLPRNEGELWICKLPNGGRLHDQDFMEGYISVDLERDPDGFNTRFSLWSHPAAC